MALETNRLLLRPPVETDRNRFVELFQDEGFMVFGARLDAEAAHVRFDAMIELSDSVEYAKQPVVDRASGTIIGYTGVGFIDFDGTDHLEWGWRLVSSARGRGLATEAVTALLSRADEVDDGTMLCLIEPDNAPSRSVADKVGFEWWKRADWHGDPHETTDVLVRQIGAGGALLRAPTSPRARCTSPSVVSHT